jgi:glycerol-1-phosphate dehydrogenase [NAD(P)+]
VLLMSGATKIAQLLAGSYRDPESGEAVGVQTRSLVMAPTLAGSERELVDGLGFGRQLAVVSDTNTDAALGARVRRALEGRYDVLSIVLPGTPHPDDVTVAEVRKAVASADALIAVGSGTINDVCKYASAQDGKPYAVFATAPSMNGYTSFNAAITMHGHKMSLPAQVPAGVFFDLAVLAAAPKRLIRAGLGDSLCRATAQADWLLSHMLLGTPYRQLPFDLLADDETPLFTHASALLAGDLAVMQNLVRTLVLAGFGTAIVGHSQPASQGEHLISHYIDMFEPKGRPPVFHGEQVGVTTLSMARLQERMLESAPRVRPDTASREDLIGRYGEEIGQSCWDEFAHKRLDGPKADALNEAIDAKWPAAVERISAITLPSGHLQAVLRSAGAEVTPAGIHLGDGFYREALGRCREIRNRYTFLDLAASAGRLDGMLPTL